MAAPKQVKLAIDGGSKACAGVWPARRLFGEAEKRAVVRLFDQSIARGEAFGYGGVEETAYCRQFADYLGGGMADGVNSGSTAMYVALRALDLPVGGEVIVSPITDPGGVMPIALCGCIPVPADTTPGSFNIGVEQIKARLTPRTVAIVVAHIAGTPADMAPIVELARKHRVAIVEDCAQAHGARYRGKPVGTLGDIAAFSTMFGKHHATGGQGGVVFTRKPELFARVRRIADRGKPFDLPAGSTNCVASLNFNMDEMHAAVGRVQLARLPRIIEARQKTAHALAQACKSLKAVRLDTGPKHADSVFWFLVATVDEARLTVDRNQFVKALAAEGVPAAPGYVVPFTQFDWYRQRKVVGQTGWPWTDPAYKGDPNAAYDLPNADAMLKTCFRISWHERVTLAHVRRIAAALAKVETAYLKR